MWDEVTMRHKISNLWLVMNSDTILWSGKNFFGNEYNMKSTMQKSHIHTRTELMEDKITVYLSNCYPYIFCYLQVSFRTSIIKCCCTLIEASCAFLYYDVTLLTLSHFWSLFSIIHFECTEIIWFEWGIVKRASVNWQPIRSTLILPLSQTTDSGVTLRTDR